MRVLLLSRCPPYPLHLGDRLIVWHVVRELAARGVTFDLLAFAERPADWSLSEQGHYASYFHDVRLFDAPHRPQSELVRRAALPSARFPRRAAHAFAPEIWRELERRDLGKYDVVHLFGGIQVYEFAHLLHDVPTVITPYESYSLLLERTLARTRDPRRWPLVRAQLAAATQYERWMFGPFDRVTVVADKDREHMLRLNPNQQIDVIPNGIELAEFTPSDATRDPRSLMFLGNYEYAPNVDAALFLAREIFPRVRRSVPDATLTLVGNAPPPELTALADDPAITVTGRVPSVVPHFNAAGAFVCPLRIGAGIKNKVLEGLAMGCAVVATPLSADGIAAHDGEHLLLGESADELAAATVRVLTTPALRDTLAANGRALIESRYTWAQSAEGYLTAYRRAAARPAPRTPSA